MKAEKVRRGKESYVYVLGLDGGYFYVGLTYDVDKRVREHMEGTGAKFTRIYRPKKLVYVIPIGRVSKQEAANLEELIAVEMIMLYGQNKVRGADRVDVRTKERSESFWRWHLAHLKRKGQTIREIAIYGGFDRSLFF
jgi:predicted GIY-YIG superfamily endonuclease